MLKTHKYTRENLDPIETLYLRTKCAQKSKNAKTPKELMISFHTKAFRWISLRVRGIKRFCEKKGLVSED